MAMREEAAGPRDICFHGAKIWELESMQFWQPPDSSCKSNEPCLAHRARRMRLCWPVAQYWPQIKIVFALDVGGPQS